jgi:hypothetical protein
MIDKMYIPTIGESIILTQPWSFLLHNEYRNSDLFEAFDLPYTGTREVTLPAGTVLKVQRIYIRGSNRGYDSVTLRTVHSPDSRLATKRTGGKSRRFWVKLNDFNTIEYERYES